MDKRKKIIIGVALVLLLFATTASGAVTEIMKMDYRKLKGTVPRGISNNNPFNLKISGRTYAGKVPVSSNTDKVHEQFENFVYGIAAGVDHLQKRYIGGGLGLGKLDTIAKILPVYAPANSGEGNVPSEYIAYVERNSGINRNAILNANDYQTMFKLTQNMLIYENGAAFKLTFFSDSNYSGFFGVAWRNVLNLPT